jgi:hypothetical protein
MQFEKDSGENRKYGYGHVHLRAVLADKLFSWNSQLKVRTQKPELYHSAEGLLESHPINICLNLRFDYSCTTLLKH